MFRCTLGAGGSRGRKGGPLRVHRPGAPAVQLAKLKRMRKLKACTQASATSNRQPPRAWGCRLGEVQRKRELMAAADAKRLEIRTAQRARHHVKLAAFLKTATAQPPLLWLPARHCGDTLLLLEQRQVDLAVWQARMSWLFPWAMQPVCSRGRSGCSPQAAQLPGTPWDVSF